MNEQNHFWNLLAKKLSGEATAEELCELEHAVKTNPDLSFAIQQVTDLWTLKTIPQPKFSEASFQKLIGKLDEPLSTDGHTNTEPVTPAPHSKKIRWLAGASLFVTGLAALYIYTNPGKKILPVAINQTTEVFVHPGTRKKMVLPDSSVVWLNAGSKLTYAEPFGVKDRTVMLTGEAFFDVVKSTKPFIIHSTGVQIKVLGTAFNVRNYPNEQKMETSLVRGRVEISLDNEPGRNYVLYPNQKLTLSKNKPQGPATVKTEVPASPVLSALHYYDSTTITETSWIENKLVFSDESFEDVAHRMERWYGVTIIFKSERLKAERFTGLFEKEVVTQALEAMRIAVPFHFTINGNEIIITN